MPSRIAEEYYKQIFLYCKQYTVLPLSGPRNLLNKARKLQWGNISQRSIFLCHKPLLGNILSPHPPAIVPRVCGGAVQPWGMLLLMGQLGDWERFCLVEENTENWVVAFPHDYIIHSGRCLKFLGVCWRCSGSGCAGVQGVAMVNKRDFVVMKPPLFYVLGSIKHSVYRVKFLSVCLWCLR